MCSRGLDYCRFTDDDGQRQELDHGSRYVHDAFRSQLVVDCNPGHHGINSNRACDSAVEEAQSSH